jgi:hypothetical protein
MQGNIKAICIKIIYTCKKYHGMFYIETFNVENSCMPSLPTGGQ